MTPDWCVQGWPNGHLKEENATLVLTRKIGETVLIAENIEVTVIEIKHGRVRLGFQCPKEIPILRQEVADREPAHEPLSQIQRFSELVVV